jgi:isopropylmalate/homocitrate/citramalate synthase
LHNQELARVLARRYVSCAVGCPYQGDVDVEVAADVALALIDMGCYEVAMSDTTGVGTPASVELMLKVSMPCRWHAHCCNLCPAVLTRLLRQAAPCH